MVTAREARQIALDFLLEEFSETEANRLVIDESATVERSYGWIFVPTAKRYLQTGRLDDQFIGAGPLLVLRMSGELIEYSSMYSPQMAAAEYESSAE
ncbi:hypothetical protein E1293_20740 [Actinomadura darangshiensis]|uniref:Immunity protein 35 domain-containing protein n=1 Tax=Actinomadura darangshiensis TaxID=705336 RepID=A0A4R5B713_9ACTN|nr:hypothetical protein E1293_20740 [Actinomadura darangshiensis]